LFFAVACSSSLFVSAVILSEAAHGFIVSG